MSTQLRYFLCTTCEHHWEAANESSCPNCGECSLIEEMTITELRDFADEQSYFRATGVSR